MTTGEWRRFGEVGGLEQFGPNSKYARRLDPPVHEDDCAQCRPLPCDDPDRHLGVPSEYTPLANRGCHCGADLDGRDCMCFE